MTRVIEDLDSEEGIPPDDNRTPLEETGEHVSASEVRARYKRSPAWLEAKVRAGAITRVKQSGKLLYKETDIVEQLEFEKKDETIVAALTAATALAEQANKNMQSMFDLTQKANKDIVESLIKSLEQMRGYVGELETQNREMRTLSEHQKTEEHLRKLAELDQEQKKNLRDRAFATISQVAVPIIAQKLGIPIPETQAKGPGLDPMVTTLAFDLLKGITPEQLVKMKEVFTPEQYQVVEMFKQVMPG